MLVAEVGRGGPGQRHRAGRRGDLDETTGVAAEVAWVRSADGTTYLITGNAVQPRGASPRRAPKSVAP